MSTKEKKTTFSSCKIKLFSHTCGRLKRFYPSVPSEWIVNLLALTRPTPTPFPWQWLPICIYLAIKISKYAQAKSKQNQYNQLSAVTHIHLVSPDESCNTVANTEYWEAAAAGLLSLEQTRPQAYPVCPASDHLDSLRLTQGSPLVGGNESDCRLPSVALLYSWLNLPQTGKWNYLHCWSQYCDVRRCLCFVVGCWMGGWVMMMKYRERDWNTKSNISNKPEQPASLFFSFSSSSFGCWDSTKQVFLITRYSNYYAGRGSASRFSLFKPL